MKPFDHRKFDRLMKGPIKEVYEIVQAFQGEDFDVFDCLALIVNLQRQVVELRLELATLREERQDDGK